VAKVFDVYGEWLSENYQIVRIQAGASGKDIVFFVGALQAAGIALRVGGDDRLGLALIESAQKIGSDGRCFLQEMDKVLDLFGYEVTLL
jgi:hypothetical protein